MSYLEIAPARAKAKSGSKLWGDPEHVAEPKLDGWRFLMHFGRGLPRVYMTGRRISKVTLKYSEKGFCAPCLWPSYPGGQLRPEYTVIDGEVMPPEGANFRDMASIMNADPETAAETIKRLGRPTYHAFDVLYYDGRDVRDEAMLVRKDLLSSVETYFGDLFRVVPTIPATQESFDEIVASGGEGVIVKNICSPYGEGWWKVKKASTLDVIITGFTDAREGRTGKYLGLIGAAKVSVYSSSGELLEVGQVSGMTDEVRVDMSERPEKWLNTVIEIESQEWAKDRLRHPRYKRPRPDANPADCTFQKLMADLNVGDDREEQEPEVAAPSKQGSLF